MSKKGIRDSVGPMVITAVVSTAVFAVIGLIVGMFWFSQEARPVVRTIRDSAAWTGKFYTMFFAGCGFSGIYSVLMALVGGHRRVNWVVNTVVTVLVGIVFAALMFILFPTKDANINVVSALLIFLQGFGIFFSTSMAAPHSWVYNPFRK